MKTINALTTSILFFSIPTMGFPHMPEVQTPHIYLPQVEKPNTINLLSYDDIISYIERIEHEDLENICNPEDLSQLNLFIAQLAEAGLLSEDGQEAEELHDDIQELLNTSDNPYSFAYSIDGQVVVPAMFYGNSYQTTLCKSWVKKACHKIKKFVKKHKNEILVGAAVVVTVVVVVVTVGAATGAAVAGAAAAAADSSSSTGSSPTVQEVIEERVADFKEAVSETIDPDLSTHHTPESFGETVRKMGSVLAHETLDGVAAVAAVVPGFMQEVSNTGQKLGFDTQSKAVENFEKIAGLGHEYIDAAFSTQLAEKYAARQKASLMFKEDMKVGIIPIAPGASGTIPMTGRVAPTQANSVKGWVSGQPIQNLTSKGNVPKWSTVRQRHWKNRAEWAKSNSNSPYGEDNIRRMENGLAPQRVNVKTGQLEKMELHHDPAQRDGGLFDFIEVWPEEHAQLDPKRFIGD